MSEVSISHSSHPLCPDVLPELRMKATEIHYENETIMETPRIMYSKMYVAGNYVLLISENKII